MHTYIGINSFPKSGNTWISGIVSYLFFEGDLDAVPSIYTTTPLNAPVYTFEDMSYSFFRSHSQCPWREIGCDGQSDSTNIHYKYIYIVRHPLDVFLSSLNWLGNVANMPTYFIGSNIKTVDQIIADGELDYYFSAFLCYMTLQPEFTDAGRWDYNAIGWKNLANTDDNISYLRFEDLLANPVDILTGIFSQLGKSPYDIQLALNHFDERYPLDNKFFWTKSANNYKRLIPKELVSKFEYYYSEPLSSLDYLPLQ